MHWPRAPASHPASAGGGPGGGEEKQYLTFVLGTEMFSLDILCIKEIIWYTNLTEVPMMPACIRGVINLRGAVVPVMDLSARFNKPPRRWARAPASSSPKSMAG
jgi:chemotaxis signal transduction protein